MNYYTTPKKKKDEPKKPKFSRLEIILFVCCIVILGTAFTIRYIQTHPSTPPCNHEYELKYSLSSSCMESGFNNYVCIHCDERYSEKIEPTGHHYSPFVVEPACERNGRTAEKCVCGDERNSEPIKATGHQYKAIPTEPPTCETNGAGIRICEACSDAQPYVINAKGHMMSGNCCINCDYKVEEVSPPQPQPQPTQPRKITVKATAYCPCEKCTINDGHIMKIPNALPKTEHTIAVDPDVIPIETVVIINGKEYIAEAIGNKINGNAIDIFFNSHEEANDFGVQIMEIIIQED